MEISLSEQLVLGILHESDRHGYDIEKTISARGMRKWTDIGFSSIYYVLDRLEKKGLATTSATIGKEKKQYSITDAGMNILKAETIKLISERKPANAHFMTGLATSHVINAIELTESFEQRKTTLLADLQRLRETNVITDNSPQSARQLIELSELLLVTELHWLSKELERTKYESIG